MLRFRASTDIRAVPTYEGKGFLAWDPAQKLMPTGDKALGDLAQPIVGHPDEARPLDAIAFAAARPTSSRPRIAKNGRMWSRL